MKKYKFAVNQIYEIPAENEEQATDLFLGTNGDMFFLEDHLVDDDWSFVEEVT